MPTAAQILQHNKKAWEREVQNGNPWTIPVTPEQIARARQGDFQLLLTPVRPIPPEWYPSLLGCRVLCLASGGGQQAPILAAAGARVTVLDNSPAQLDCDRRVAQREHLDLELVEGDMADLSVFSDGSFDFILHPVSNCFVPHVRPFWKEAFRVLRAGGRLAAGFLNPLQYCFDEDLAQQGIFQLRHTIPYADLTSLSAEERRRRYPDEPLEFGHSLQDQIGGQLAAGFHLIDFYEDISPEDKLSAFMPLFFATLVLKPSA